jgi:putative ABC transport system substrate-binding protein
MASQSASILRSIEAPRAPFAWGCRSFCSRPLSPPAHHVADDLHVTVNSTNELESVFRTWDDDQIGGLVMVDHALVIAHASLIGAMAKKYGFRSIGPLELPTNGGLLGYGVNFLDMFRRAATFVDKVLKGAKPADIPVEQATTFKFLVNLKVANALGLEVPPTLLARADEVIE